MIFQSLTLQSAHASQKKALVYRGPGGCDSCAAAAAVAVRAAGLRVQFVNQSTLTEATLKGAILWVQPAGNAITVAGALKADGLDLVRQFVKNGGSYVGFCAGAFLTDRTVDNAETIQGLGLIPFSSADYVPVKNQDLPVMVWTNWSGKRREIFFNGGATFLIPANQKGVNVIATYEKDNMPAALEIFYGKGHVVISGAHPEAPSIWKTRNGLKDEDGQDLDLATKMVRLSLQKTLSSL